MYLDYLIKKPDFIDYKKNNNVIFLLHGYGSNEVIYLILKIFLMKMNLLFLLGHQ